MKFVNKFQQGGPMGPQQEGQDPAAQIQQMAQEIVQQLGPEGAMMLAQAIAQIAQGAQGGAPAGAPEEGAPEEGAPAMRNGGSLHLVSRRNGRAVFQTR